MFRSNVRVLTFALAIALAACTAALAQPNNGSPTAPPAARMTLSNEQAFASFRTLDPNAQQIPGGNPIRIDFKYPHKTGHVPLRVEMNEGYVWFTCATSSVLNADKLPSELLARMLRSHVPIGPTFFRIVRQGERDVIELSHRIDRPADTGRLAAALREMANDIETTLPIWSTVEKAIAK